MCKISALLLFAKICLRHRKASLALMRKMVHYIPRPLLEEICNPDYMSVNFGALLVEVVATVLDHEVGVSYLRR